jgi:uncharacterized protein involved in copper resistance
MKVKDQKQIRLLASRHDVFFLHPGSQSAQACIAGTLTSLFEQRSTSPRPEQTGSDVSAWFCGGIGRDYMRMLVRGTAHGMQGHLRTTGIQGLYPNPHVPGLAIAKFMGTRLGLRKRPRRGERVLSEAAGRVYAGERTWP